jgi:hypothetical protein
LSESKLLSKISFPFIINLYGSFQVSFSLICACNVSHSALSTSLFTPLSPSICPYMRRLPLSSLSLPPSADPLSHTHIHKPRTCSMQASAHCRMTSVCLPLCLGFDDTSVYTSMCMRGTRCWRTTRLYISIRPVSLYLFSISLFMCTTASICTRPCSTRTLNPQR